MGIPQSAASALQAISYKCRTDDAETLKYVLRLYNIIVQPEDLEALLQKYSAPGVVLLVFF